MVLVTRFGWNDDGPVDRDLPRDQGLGDDDAQDRPRPAASRRRRPSRRSPIDRRLPSNLPPSNAPPPAAGDAGADA